MLLDQAYAGLGYGETLLGRCARDVWCPPSRKLANNELTWCYRMGNHVDGLKFAGGKPYQPDAKADPQN